MLQLLIRRLAWSALTLVVVAVVVFGGVEALPGDACTAYLGRNATEARLEKCRTRFDLDRPALVRMGEWFANALQGDFGKSLKRGKPIGQALAPRFRNTLLLAAAAALVGIPLAILLGVLAALWRDKPLDVILSTTAIIGMTMPEFVSATLLILVFSIWLGWLPGIVVAPPDAPIGQMLSGIVLPCLALALVMTAHILRMVRTSVIDVMASDFVQMARLKGVPYWRMVFRHVLPNALVPAINLIALNVAWLLGGVVVIEVVFNYPGLGRLTIDAISDRDLPLVQAIALVLAAIYVGVNLIADILTLFANPRLKTLRT
jgi:peptide/nickel transport system permease protein